MDVQKLWTSLTAMFAGILLWWLEVRANWLHSPLLMVAVVGAVVEVVTGESLTCTNFPSQLTGTERISQAKRTPPTLKPPMAMVTIAKLTAAVCSESITRCPII